MVVVVPCRRSALKVDAMTVAGADNVMIVVVVVVVVVIIVVVVVVPRHRSGLKVDAVTVAGANDVMIVIVVVIVVIVVASASSPIIVAGNNVPMMMSRWDDGTHESDVLSSIPSIVLRRR